MIARGAHAAGVAEPVGPAQRGWVEARSAGDSAAPPREFVLRMRAGPGVWDLVRPAG